MKRDRREMPEGGGGVEGVSTPLDGCRPSGIADCGGSLLPCSPHLGTAEHLLANYISQLQEVGHGVALLMRMYMRSANGVISYQEDAEDSKTRVIRGGRRVRRLSPCGYHHV